MKSLFSTIIVVAALDIACVAATVAVDIDSGSKSIRDDAGNPLSGGLLLTAFDGTQVRLGYFADGTAAAPFGVAGASAISSFIALTGPGTPFGVNFTIGDSVANSAGHGELFVDAFALNTGIQDSLFPSNTNVPLVLRFFNASQDKVLDISNINGLWNWKLPDSPAASISMSLDSAGVVARGVGLNVRTHSAVGSAPQTLNSVVPEPTSAALMMVGMLSLAARCRRRAI